MKKIICLGLGSQRNLTSIVVLKPCAQRTFGRLHRATWQLILKECLEAENDVALLQYFAKDASVPSVDNCETPFFFSFL